MIARLPSATRASVVLLACSLTACLADGTDQRSQRRDDSTCPGAFDRGHEEACFDTDDPPEGDEPHSGDYWIDWERIRKNTERPRCDGVPNDAGAARTAGTLTVSLMTKPLDGRYTPANSGAIWIESAPAGETSVPADVREQTVESGEYVRSLELWAQVRRMNLVTWQSTKCETVEEPDIVTSATLPDHARPHELTWDGTDFAGNIPPDGEYVLWMEIAEDEIYPTPTKQRVIFTKGPFVTSRTRTDVPGIASMSLTFTPVGSAPTAP